MTMWPRKAPYGLFAQSALNSVLQSTVLHMVVINPEFASRELQTFNVRWQRGGGPKQH